MLNPLAEELNASIAAGNPYVLEMFSELGKRLFFPKGILSQSAEAKDKATRFNATIGIATEGQGPMYLPCIQEKLNEFNPKDLYPYAPPAGKPELRQLWRDKIIRENPTVADKHFSNPVVTNALTHGLSMVADMFVDPGDHLVLADKMWGNYNLTFQTRCQADIQKHPTFTPQGSFNVEAFKKQLQHSAQTRDKIVVLLNFPNNPSGYTPTVEEGKALVAAIKEVAEAGTNLVVVTDDAYFGLFYEDSLQESMFGYLANLHPRVLAIKLDGATKEEYVWGFRTGFITFADGTAEAQSELYTALEKKCMGLIRGSISNCPHPSQTFVLNALQSPDFAKQKAEKFAIMQGRARKVKELLTSGRYADAFDYYPFNSGYFMCLALKHVNAETLRLHLLDQYGVGTIAIGNTDLRIAFSCIEEQDLPELFDTIYQAAKDLA